MKAKTTLNIIGAALGIAGFAIIGINSNWYVALGVFLFIYGENITKSASKL